MLNSRLTLVFYVTILLGVSCHSPQRKVSIIPLKKLNITDSTVIDGKKLIAKAEYYLVKEYVDTKYADKYIDSFVAKTKAADLDKYTDYSIFFYKESSQTNEKTIAELKKKVIDRYSNDDDAIYQYKWSDGAFVAKYKFKNGVIINSDIKVFDIPEH